MDELKDYEVEIVETLTKTVPAKATDPADAVATVRKLYRNDVIELTADDLIDTDFVYQFSAIVLIKTKEGA